MQSTLRLGVCALIASLALSLLASAPLHAAPGACAKIRDACKSAGFTQSGALQRECFDPIVNGTPQPKGAKPLPHTDAQAVAACATSSAGGKPAPRSTAATAAKAASTPPNLTGTPGDGGKTLHDDSEHVTWLTDGNLASTEKFGVAGINPDGSMDYATALLWIKAMNKSTSGKGYLGHANWTLPTTPSIDRQCDAHKVNTFGYNCRGSAMGSLYYNSFGFAAPSTAVPMPANKVGLFSNFQPYLYWSVSGAAGHPKNTNGYDSFSFNGGFHGSNVDHHNLYALPMIAHELTGKQAPAAAKTNGDLQPSADGQTVYDARLHITWLADADLAAKEQFGVGGINVDGSMSHTTALAWIAAMNKQKYLGQGDWTLPPTAATDKNCTLAGKSGFNCDGSPMGALFYDRLGRRQGQPIVATPDIRIGAFHHMQPYLYWSCTGATGQTACGKPPAPNFGWSFSFGSGFEGTDLVKNDLYVIPYYPDPVIPTPPPLPPHPCGTRCV